MIGNGTYLVSFWGTYEAKIVGNMPGRCSLCLSVDGTLWHHTNICVVVPQSDIRQAYDIPLAPEIGRDTNELIVPSLHQFKSKACDDDAGIEAESAASVVALPGDEHMRTYLFGVLREVKEAKGKRERVETH